MAKSRLYPTAQSVKIVVMQLLYISQNPAVKCHRNVFCKRAASGQTIALRRKDTKPLHLKQLQYRQTQKGRITYEKNRKLYD